MDNETLTQEGDNAFPTEETPQDSSPETQVEDTTKTTEPEVTQSSEGENTQDEQIPWHKDKRWIAWQEEKKTLESQVTELSTFKEKAEPLLSRFEPKEEVNIPSWFGGDETAWKAYQADQSRIIEEAKEKAIHEIDERTNKEQARIKEANEHLERSIADLESAGNKVDKNKLLKFVMDNELIDTQGRWNYQKGFEFMTAMEKAKVEPSNLDARKQIAAATTSESKAEPKKKDYETPDSLKGKGFFNLY